MNCANNNLFINNISNQNGCGCGCNGNTAVPFAANNFSSNSALSNGCPQCRRESGNCGCQSNGGTTGCGCQNCGCQNNSCQNCGCQNCGCQNCGCQNCGNAPSQISNTAIVTGMFANSCTTVQSSATSSIENEITNGVTVSKTSDRQSVIPGDIIRYNISVTNNTGCTISCLRLTDDLDPQLTFIPGSICPSSCVCDDFCSGITLPNLVPGQTTSVSFAATVSQCANCAISNTAALSYNILNASGNSQPQIAFSNEVVIPLSSSCGCPSSLSITKSADRSVVTSNCEAVNYTLNVTNSGICPLENVIVRDVLPETLLYKPCSTVVNCASAQNLNPAFIPLGRLNAGESVTIRYTAIVDLCR